MSFKTWMKAVDLLVLKSFEPGVYELPDVSARSAHDAGLTPEEFFELSVRFGSVKS